MSDPQLWKSVIFATTLTSISLKPNFLPTNKIRRLVGFFLDDSPQMLNPVSNCYKKRHTVLAPAAFSRMDERIVRVNSVAQQGNIDGFYNLIGEDVKLLEHIDELPFVDTPLHIAASVGHIPFALEMMGLKPSFARKLNPNGFSPIHLALRNGHIEMVRRLLQVDGDLVSVKGRECHTPLHYVAATDDQLDLLAEFLSFCPDSIANVTIRNETALHIALRNKELKAFKFLVRWLRKNRFKNDEFWESTILNWEDNDGNTVLHLAVLNNQAKAVKKLLKSGVNINAKNLEGERAWNILMANKKISVMQRCAGALPASCHASVTSFTYYLYSMVLFLKKLGMHFIREKTRISENRRNTLLVIASLLITITYQGILSPPGGLWQEDYYPNNTRQPNTRNTVGHLTFEDVAGTSIGYRLGYPFWIFLMSNTLTFVISYLTILLLIPATYICIILRLAFLALFICYFASLVVLVPKNSWLAFSALSIVVLYSLVGVYFSRKIWWWLGRLVIRSWGWLGHLLICSCKKIIDG